jgi:hypothetical protein
VSFIAVQLYILYTLCTLPSCFLVTLFTNIPMQTRKKQRFKESRVPCKDHEAVLDEIDEDAAHQRQLS